MIAYNVLHPGGSVTVYDFLELRESATIVDTLSRLIQRLPDAHARVLWPIFIIDRKPGGGLNGGTWPALRVRDAFRGREARTGVPFEELDRLLPDGSGLCGIPQNRWLGRAPMSTAFHEIAHAIDMQLDLTPPWLREHHLRGVHPICGGANSVAKYAVEAYARWIVTPSEVCRTLSDGESQAQADNRVFAALIETPAFAGVPESWDPSHRRRRGRWAGAPRPPEAILAR